MSDAKTWPRVAVIGAGAVGGYFGGMLAYAGAPVTMIGRQAFVDAVKADGLFLDTTRFQAPVHVEASTDLAAASGADLILFCVKTLDNENTARQLGPYVAPNATVISLQNGVDNADRIRSASNIDALSAVVYVAASVPSPGHIKHTARGDLVIGPKSARTEQIAEVFSRADIPCRISDNIEGELWTKFLWNCALNAVSALGNARYGQIADDEHARSVVAALIKEIMAVAHASNVVLPNLPDSQAAMKGAMTLSTQLSGAFSSTAQDIQRGKHTEIDSLNGYIARRGAELGVPTPVNQAVFALVKLLEQSAESKP